MFPPARQAKLDPILTALRNIHGVAQVQQDDWDSAGINVVVMLDRRERVRFVARLQSVRAAIKRALKGTDFGYLDWPQMQYGYFAASPGIPREKYKKGYDTDAFKLEVSV